MNIFDKKNIIIEKTNVKIYVFNNQGSPEKTAEKIIDYCFQNNLHKILGFDNTSEFHSFMKSIILGDCKKTEVKFNTSNIFNTVEKTLRLCTQYLKEELSVFIIPSFDSFIFDKMQGS